MKKQKQKYQNQNSDLEILERMCEIQMRASNMIIRLIGEVEEEITYTISMDRRNFIPETILDLRLKIKLKEMK